MGVLNRLKFDPRLEPGAYIQDGKRLLQVIKRVPAGVILENCVTPFSHTSTTVAAVLRDFELAKPSPQTPDFVMTDIADSDAP